MKKEDRIYSGPQASVKALIMAQIELNLTQLNGIYILQYGSDKNNVHDRKQEKGNI